MLIRTILRKEINDALGREPTIDEQISCFQYLRDVLDLDKLTLAAIGCAIYDWRNDCCSKCPICENWYLSETMVEDDEDGEFFCGSEDCLETKRENTYDMKAEHGFGAFEYFGKNEYQM